MELLDVLRCCVTAEDSAVLVLNAFQTGLNFQGTFVTALLKLLGNAEPVKSRLDVWLLVVMAGMVQFKKQVSGALPFSSVVVVSCRVRVCHRLCGCVLMKQVLAVFKKKITARQLSPEAMASAVTGCGIALQSQFPTLLSLAEV
jgi:hypothetical protein